YDAEKSLAVLFALAECEARDGQSAAALEHFRQYAQALAAATSDEQAREAARRKTAEVRIEALERAVPELAFTDVPDGAIVRVAGRVVPFVGHVLVDPGDHVVVVELLEGRKIGQKVTVAAGERVRVSAAVPAEKPAPPEPAPEPPSPPPKPAPGP